MKRKQSFSTESFNLKSQVWVDSIFLFSNFPQNLITFCYTELQTNRKSFDHHVYELSSTVECTNIIAKYWEDGRLN